MDLAVPGDMGQPQQQKAQQGRRAAGVQQQGGEARPAVRQGGALPRKTFSMGEPDEKRYYMECRKIV